MMPHPGSAAVTVIVNPSARRARRTSWRAALDVLASRYAPRVSEPATVDELDQSVRLAVATHVRCIVIAGGDGTVNRVVRAMDGADVPIGILPLGTGNDFAKALDLPASSVAAARVIVAGRTRRIDLAAVNGHVFCTAGLLGLPADAAMAVRRWFHPNAATRPLLHVLGESSYKLAGARQLLKRQLTVEPYELATATDHPPSSGASAGAGSGQLRVSMRAYGLFVANTRVLGGGLVLPVESKDDDGRMEIALIPEMSRIRLLWAFTCFARGWRVPRGSLHVIRTSRASIVCGGTRGFAADGDLMCEADRFDLALRPGALRVLC